MQTKAFIVRTADQGDTLADFETYEVAHYEAFGIYEQTGVYTEVLQGDEMVWNSKHGYCCA